MPQFVLGFLLIDMLSANLFYLAAFCHQIMYFAVVKSPFTFMFEFDISNPQWNPSVYVDWPGLNFQLHKLCNRKNEGKNDDMVKGEGKV